MNQLEKKISQELSDSISQQAHLLQSMGWDCSDIFDTLKDVNIALVEDKKPMSPEVKEIFDLCLNEGRRIRDEFVENDNYPVRQSVHSGAL